MPWDMKDYPQSMKNLPELVRKKAIDIANALIEDGYSDDRAIPIATSQAKKWYEDASKEEKKEFENADNPQKDDPHSSNSNEDLIDNPVEVIYKDDEWKVRTVGAERAAYTFSTKEEAVERAKEMAENKESKLSIYKKDGTLQKEI